MFFKVHLSFLSHKKWNWLQSVQWVAAKWIVKIEKLRKQPPRGVPWKRFSENMQQIYRRTPLPKCDFKKVAKQLYWNRTSAWVFSCKFVAYFQNIFFQEHLWTAASETSRYTQWNLKGKFSFLIKHLSFVRNNIICS